MRKEKTHFPKKDYKEIIYSSFSFFLFLLRFCVTAKIIHYERYSSLVTFE